MIKNTYDDIWEQYVNLYDKFTFDIQEDVLKFFAEQSSGKVLDAGCGVGKLFSYLKLNLNIDYVYAIEKNSNMFLKAQSKSKYYKNVKVIQDDICSKNFNKIGKKFKPDTVVSINVLYSLENPIKFLMNTFNILNKGGKLLISSPNRNVDFKNKILPYISLDKNIRYGSLDDFKSFIKINNILVDTSKGYIRNYSLEEMMSILEIIGFKILFKKNSDYLNCNFTIIAQKL